MLGRFYLFGCLMVPCLMCSACNSGASDQPDLGQVTGVVILDGTPVEGVMVNFAPEKGRGSQGLTDSNGKYELSYVRQAKGAIIGNHKVYINTPQGDDDSDPDAPVIEEKIPAEYNTKSTLTAEVKAGDNPIDFELLSK